MYSVMIVDDVKFTRDELKSFDIWGEKTGFVITAESDNGRDALLSLRKQTVDLLITDIRMPMVDGIELTKHALDERLCKCVVLMSQFSDFEFARQGIHHGAFEYLLKPVDMDDLLMALNRVAVRINERNRELIRIEYADQVLNCQDKYPYEKLKMLIKSIEERSSETCAIAADIFDTIWRETGSEPKEALYYLKRMLNDFLDAFNIVFPWYNKLVRSEKNTALVLPATEAGEALRASFLAYIGEMNDMVSHFVLGQSDSLIKTACKYVLENLDAPISVNAISKKLFISNSYLSFLFKRTTGINVNEYINTVKMERSRILLEEGILKNYEIADRIGFSIEYFSKLFKKHHSMSPSRYRRSFAPRP